MDDFKQRCGDLLISDNLQKLQEKLLSFMMDLQFYSVVASVRTGVAGDLQRQVDALQDLFFRLEVEVNKL